MAKLPALSAFVWEGTDIAAAGTATTSVDITIKGANICSYAWVAIRAV